MLAPMKIKWAPVEILLAFIADPENRDLSQANRAWLAAVTESSPDYLWQIATGRRQASPRLAMKVDAKTSGRIPRSHLRSDLWQEIA